MSDEDSDINKMISKLDAQTKAATSARNRLETSLDRSQKLEQNCNKHLIGTTNAYKSSLILLKKERMKSLPSVVKGWSNYWTTWKQKNAGVKENKIIEAKGELNNLERQANNLAHNKVLQREKRRHHVSVGDRVKVLSYGQTGTITKKLSEHEYEVQMGIIKVKLAIVILSELKRTNLLSLNI